MAKRRKPKKDKHHNGQNPQTKERQTLQWPKAVNQRNVCLSLVYDFWSL
jgi:hypothetical protein